MVISHRVLAEPLCRRLASGDRPDDSRQRQPTHRSSASRRRTSRARSSRCNSISGCRPRSRRRCLPDRRSWTIATSAATPPSARLRPASDEARAARRVLRRDEELATRFPGEQRPHRRRADAVLARAARTASDVHHRARHPAGRDAAGAARRVRQHRQPRAGAGQRALPRGRRAARPWRRARQTSSG